MTYGGILCKLLEYKNLVGKPCHLLSKIKSKEFSKSFKDLSPECETALQSVTNFGRLVGLILGNCSTSFSKKLTPSVDFNHFFPIIVFQ